MALSLSQILQLVCFSLLLACGQTLFKYAAVSLPPLTSIPSFVALLTNLWFWGALVLYGTATLLWIIILQNVALSLAYPFAALGFIFVPAIAWILFKEPLNAYYLIGIILIIGGLGMITVMGSK